MLKTREAREGQEEQHGGKEKEKELCEGREIKKRRGEKEGKNERDGERKRERATHASAGARSRALGTHTCTSRAHAYHRTAEKTARERRSNGQTEPRANQVLWPVAFPITLRLGSPPVCPKEAVRSSWVLRSSTWSARKRIHAGHSKRSGIARHRLFSTFASLDFFHACYTYVYFVFSIEFFFFFFRFLRSPTTDDQRPAASDRHGRYTIYIRSYIAE